MTPPPGQGQSRGPDPQRFSHVLAPLRARGLECDIDFGQLWLVRGRLPDGSELIIAGPTDVYYEDDADPPGWTVLHQHAEGVPLYGVPYDSTPGAPHEHFGSSIEPMLDRIDLYCQEMRIQLRQPLSGPSREAAPPPALALTGLLPSAVLSIQEATEVIAAAAQAPFTPTNLGPMATVLIGKHHYDIVAPDSYPPRIITRRGPEGTDFVNCRATPAEEAALRDHLASQKRTANRTQQQPPAPQPGSPPPRRSR